MSGVRIALSDGINSQIIDETDEDSKLEELDEKKILIDVTLPFVKEVSVAPLIIINEKQNLGKIATSKTLDDEEVIDSLKNNQNLVAWYRFENNADDEKGLYDGVCTPGKCQYNEGKINQAVKISNSVGGTAIEESNIPGTTFINSYSIAGWFYPNIYSLAVIQKRGGNDFIVGVTITNSIVYSPSCQYNNIANKLAYMFGKGQASCRKWLFSNNQLELNKWYHFVAVYDKNAGIGKLYLNGVLQQEDSSDSLTLAPTSKLAIGGAPSDSVTGWKYFDGKIDEAMIFNKALTENEVKAIYNLEF